MNGIDYALLASVASSGLWADGTLSPVWAACKTFSEVVGFISAVLLLATWLRWFLRRVREDGPPPPSLAPASAKVLGRSREIARRMRNLRLTVINGAKDVLDWLSAAGRGKRPVRRSHAGPECMSELFCDAMLRSFEVGVDVEIKSDITMLRAEVVRAAADLRKAWALSTKILAKGQVRTDDHKSVVGMAPVPMRALVGGRAVLGQKLMARDGVRDRGAAKDLNLLLRCACILLVRALDGVRGVGDKDDVSRLVTA